MSSSSKSAPSTASKAQIDKFKEAAREVGTDDSEEAFDRRLKQVAKPKVERKDAKN